MTVDRETGDVLLTITDNLDWEDNEGRHLILLQKKLNSYLQFIESGELLENFPETKGREIVINLVGQFPLSEKANIFFKRAESAIRDSGLKLQFRQFGLN